MYAWFDVTDLLIWLIALLRTVYYCDRLAAAIPSTLSLHIPVLYCQIGAFCYSRGAQLDLRL